MALEDISKKLGRTKRSVNLYLHRHRNDPRLIKNDNMLLRILRKKFKNPELFNPARTFLDTVRIGQKRYHAIYKGKETMTDDECKRICTFFEIDFADVMEIRQTSLFPEETIAPENQDNIVEIPNENIDAIQLNFLTHE